MSGSVNYVMIVGNLVRDPECRFLNDGSKVVNMTVATSERWKDKSNGEQREKSEFHRIVVFNDRVADTAEKYLRKGSKVAIQGSLQTRKWTDQSGVEKYTTEIVLQKFRGELTMLGGGQRDDNSGGGEYGQSEPDYNAGNKGVDPNGNPGDDLSDEIPFVFNHLMY